MNPPFPKIGAPLNSEPIPSLQWIEVSTSLQIPCFHIIGLPSPEVAEARERVRSAIESSGLEFPRRKVVVNLSPASVRKRGTGLDLSIALAILAESPMQSRARPLTSWVAWAELGLDGRVKPAGQILRAVYAAWKEGASALLVSPSEYDEAIARKDWLRSTGEFGEKPAPQVLAPETLTDAWSWYRSSSAEWPRERDHDKDTWVPDEERISELLPLPPSLERVVAIASVGHHHLLLLGPRGTGKSHALDWVVALHPPASPGALLKTWLMAEMLGFRPDPQRVFPVRRVGSQVRPAALTGWAGPHFVRPGEFSLAQGGILLADELLEWSRDARESLREPLERGKVTLTRAQASLELPARFTLAANGNLCPCGGWPRQLPMPLESRAKDGANSLPPLCSCAISAKRAYLRRISGPILDRIDLVHFGAGNRPPGLKKHAYQELRARVLEAQDRSVARWGAPAGLLSAVQTEELLNENPDWARACAATSGLSLRGRHKLVRLALSLAAWDRQDQPRPAHFAEAACYRAERFGLGDSPDEPIRFNASCGAKEELPSRD